MKTFGSFEEIEQELHRLKLERQIGIERMKGLKGEFTDHLKPVNWIGTAASIGWKYGSFFLLKKLFR